MTEQTSIFKYEEKIAEDNSEFVSIEVENLRDKVRIWVYEIAYFEPTFLEEELYPEPEMIEGTYIDLPREKAIEMAKAILKAFGEDD